MDHQQFLKLADVTLNRLADWLEPFDPDEVDFSTTDGVVAIDFPDGKKFILNRQIGNDQMWFAAGVRAHHYNWNAEASEWQDDKDGHELFARVAKVVSQKIGREVTIQS